MDFLRWLEQLRTPFGDVLMSLVTHLGEETLFMVVALVFFWCVDKKRGYYLLFSGFTGTVCIQFLKMIFRIPRPWVLDPNFTIVESARAEATGYSFPSGHTQCATDLYGGMARSSKKRAMQIGGVVLCLLIALSRMYLGVHTPLDVLVSLAIGAALVLILYPVIYRCYERPKYMYLTIGIILLLTLANLLFVMLYPFPADVDAVNLADAQENAFKLFFIILGMCILYPADVNFLKFDTKAVWWAQLIKLAGGIALILVVRLLLKTPLNALFGVNLGSGIRYFLIVIVAGVLWPMTFNFWARLGKKEQTV
ncbi:MAG: phosphatase PAP2 family protein [Clostridia bacterium]|nr:phosphatase PAP2 family protein [Clostridia bacterium]